jgi:predicted secreted hydrolase
MSLRILAVLLLALVPRPVHARPAPGLETFLDHCLSTGSVSEAEEVVASLEQRALPNIPSRVTFLEGIRQVLARHGQRALLARLDHLPRPFAPEPERSPVPFVFPADNGVHHTSLSEWWYFTGNLKAGAAHWGYELTFFRTAVGANFAHVALSDIAGRGHPFERRFFRIRDVHYAAGKMDVRYGGWSAIERADGSLDLHFTAEGNQVDLNLTSIKEPMSINGDGVIDMPEGTTSRYYSFTRLRTTGTVQTARGTVSLTGQSWYDHQWGNFIVFFRPWDWFSFQMEDGTDYNLFSFRKSVFGREYNCVNRLSPVGTLGVENRMGLERRSWWKSPHTGDRYVMNWMVKLPGTNETFDVSTPLEDQEMYRSSWYDFPLPYWEGTIDVLRHNPDGTTTRGVGYCEHMPY